MRKKRILGFGDFGWSGLAQCLRLTLSHLHYAGHEVWYLATGFDGNPNRVDRNTYPYAERVLPCSYDRPLGGAVFPDVVGRVQPDVILSGVDLWWMDPLLLPEVVYGKVSAAAIHTLGHATRHFTYVAYFPLENLYKGGYLNREAEALIGLVDVPVCFSDFSRQGVLRSSGLDVPMIPVPIDTKIFYPRGCSESRRILNYPFDAFLVGMVGMNQWRKLWGEFYKVMGRVVKRHPNVRVVPWSTPMGNPGGCDMDELIYRNDLEHAVIMRNIHLTDEGMAHLYSALDLVVLTTAAEGAGLPPMQARACGTPALVSANTSNIEFAGHPFELVPSKSKALIHGFVGPQNTEVYMTDIDVLEERIEKLYVDRAFREEVAEASLQSMRALTPEMILPLWENLIDSIG